MKKIALLILSLFATYISYSQGGPNCTVAQANPIVASTLYTAQTTCGKGNNFSLFNGQDWLYMFCATQSGCLNIDLSNMKSGDTIVPANVRLRVFNTCVINNNAVASRDYTIPALTTAGSTQLKMNVTSGTCYYILMEVDDFGAGYADCFYFDMQLNISNLVSQSPGANTCAGASAAINIGSSYSNQTLCCVGNNYTATTGNDWFYKVCATANGCMQINLDSIYNTDNYSTSYLNVQVYNSCALSGVLASNNAGTNPYGSKSLRFNVTAGQCYYILMTSPNALGQGGCINYKIGTQFTNAFVQTPGGNSCLAASQAPIVPNTLYAGQTTCGISCDQVGTDTWYYYFCATAKGCATLYLDSIFSNNPWGYQYIDVLKNNAIQTSLYNFLSPGINGTDSAVLKFDVNAGDCFCIRVQTFSGNCSNYRLYLDLSTGTNQVPGGNTTAIANTLPIVIGTSYPNQTTCCLGNDQNNRNGKDWDVCLIRDSKDKRNLK
jgi:hypothetical protein